MLKKSLALLALTLSLTVNAAHYVITDLGGFGGAAGSFASGVNDYGVVVGSAWTADNGIRAFRYAGTLQMLSTNSSQAFAINNNGEIVGRDLGNSLYYSDSTGLTLFGGIGSAYDINRHSTVVGYNHGSTGYIYQNGEQTLVGGTASIRRINDSDNRIDYAGSAQYSFYEDGISYSLTGPEGGLTIAQDLNNNNQVVGYTKGVDGYYDMFLFQDEMMDTFGLDGNHIYSRAINDSGIIVGEYGTPSFCIQFIYQ